MIESGTTCFLGEDFFFSQNKFGSQPHGKKKMCVVKVHHWITTVLEHFTKSEDLDEIVHMCIYTYKR